jgi:hypothetical protein
VSVLVQIATVSMSSAASSPSMLSTRAPVDSATPAAAASATSATATNSKPGKLGQQTRVQPADPAAAEKPDAPHYLGAIGGNGETRIPRVMTGEPTFRSRVN